MAGFRGVRMDSVPNSPRRWVPNSPGTKSAWFQILLVPNSPDTMKMIRDKLLFRNKFCHFGKFSHDNYVRDTLKHVLYIFICYT